MLQSQVKHAWVYNGCRPSLHQAPTVSSRHLPALLHIEENHQNPPFRRPLIQTPCTSMTVGVLSYPQEIVLKITHITNIPQLPVVAPGNRSCHAPPAKSWVCRIHLTPHRNLGFIVLILQMRKGSLKGRNELLQVTEPVSDTVQTQSCLLMPISLCRSFPRNSGYSGGKQNITKSRRAIDAVTIRLTTDFRPRGQDAKGEAWEGKEAPFSY